MKSVGVKSDKALTINYPTFRVDYWHKTDMPNASANVRFRGVADLASLSADLWVHGPGNWDEL